MITVRRNDQRGHFQNDWLNSHHSFSFGSYHDPKHMGISSLRVINDDRVVPGGGFATHSHRDMEIVSYVLEGELEHRDSIGNGSIIRPGDVQRMSAGSGITHSEFNPSETDAVHFLQIWLLPSSRGIEPGYAQKFFAPEQRKGQLRLLVSNDGADGSIDANTDALLFGSLLDDGQQVTHQIKPERAIYLHVARGEVSLNGEALGAGDGASVNDKEIVNIAGRDNAEILLFDLPASV